jgi:hypothetical protein
MTLVHIAYLISTIEIFRQNHSLLLLPSLDWRSDYFYYRQRNRRSFLIRAIRQAALLTSLPMLCIVHHTSCKIPRSSTFQPSILLLTFLSYFLLSIICIRMESSPQKWQTVLLRTGRHLAFSIFS